MFRQLYDSLLKDLNWNNGTHPSKPFKLKQWESKNLLSLGEVVLIKCDLPCALSL